MVIVEGTAFGRGGIFVVTYWLVVVMVNLFLFFSYLFEAIISSN